MAENRDREPEKQQEFLEQVRGLVQETRAMEQDIEEAGRLPETLRAKMVDLGLFGMVLPESEGGLGMPLVAGCRAMEWIGTTHPALRVALSGSNGLVGPLLVLSPVPMEMRNWLRKLASGEWRAALAMSEPDAGSRLEAMRTEAHRDAGAWVLTGDKAPVTEGADADLVMVLAVTDPGGPRRERFSLFALRKGEFEVAWNRRTWGSRAHRLAGLSFKEVLLHEDRLVGSVGGGLRFLARALVPARILISAAAVGLSWRLVAETALKAARPWPGNTTGKTPQGPADLYASLADLDSVSGTLGQMAAELAASRRLVAHAADLADRWLAGHRELGRAARRAAAAAKLAASETASRTSDAALQILGAHAVTDEGVVGVLLREAKLLGLAEGSAQILRRSVSGDILRAASRDLRKAAPKRDDFGEKGDAGEAGEVGESPDSMANLDSLLESL